MPLNFRKYLEGVGIVPKSTSTADIQGELEVSSVTGKMGYHNGTSVSPVVTEAHSATLTNKTIDGDDNTVQDLPITSIKTIIGDANKALVRDGSGVPTSALIVNANINTAAAITRTKLATGNANRILVNDASGIISENAALSGSSAVSSDSTGKLQSSTTSSTELNFLTGVTSSVQTQLDSKSTKTLTDGHIFIGNASNVATDATPSGDITLTNTGVFGIATGVIVNSDVNASAAISLTKLAATGTSKAIVSDSGGILGAHGTTTASEIGFLTGVTSAIQSQIDAKVAGQASSVDSEVALFSGTGGKTIKRATGTGYVKVSSGVFQTPAATVPRADVAAGTANHVIINDGSGNLSSEATLAVSRGGTSLATLTANNVIIGNGTSAPTFVAPGASGNVLTSNGTTWTSASNAAFTPVVASISSSSTSLGTSDTTVTFSTTDYDPAGISSAGSGTFTVNATGVWRFGCLVLGPSVLHALGGPLDCNIYVNGSSRRRIALALAQNANTYRLSANGYVELSLNSGDVITLRCSSDVAGAIPGGSGNCYFLTSRVS